MAISKSSECHCPDLCNSVWYRQEISRVSIYIYIYIYNYNYIYTSQGLYPNPVAKYPASIKKRPEFMNMTDQEFENYAKYIIWWIQRN